MEEKGAYGESCKMESIEQWWFFFFEERTFKSIALKETCQQKTHM